MLHCILVGMASWLLQKKINVESINESFNFKDNIINNSSPYQFLMIKFLFLYSMFL